MSYEARSTSDQVSLDSALMLAKQKRQQAHDHCNQASGQRAIADELNQEVSGILAPIGRKLGAIIRRINRDLMFWYDQEVGDPLNRHKYDSPPRMEWGNENQHHIGFQDAFNRGDENATMSVCVKFYSHRYRLSLVRHLHTDKYNDIVRLIETLSEAGKSAIASLHRSGAPCWVTT